MRFNKDRGGNRPNMDLTPLMSLTLRLAIFYLFGHLNQYGLPLFVPIIIIILGVNIFLPGPLTATLLYYYSFRLTDNTYGSIKNSSRLRFCSFFLIILCTNDGVHIHIELLQPMENTWSMRNKWLWLNSNSIPLLMPVINIHTFYVSFLRVCNTLIKLEQIKERTLEERISLAGVVVTNHNTTNCNQLIIY